MMRLVGRSPTSGMRQPRSDVTLLLLVNAGSEPVTFQLLLRGQDRPLRVRAQVSSHIRVRPSASLLDEVERICGQGAAELR